MTDYKLTREEQETTIIGNAASREWEIVTADPRMIRKMAKQGYLPEQRENPWGYVSFRIPLNRLSIRRAQKPKPSEKQSAARAKSHFKPKSPEEIPSSGDQNPRVGVGIGDTHV